jgi:beta-1,3-galactosyltransferase 2
VIYFKFAGRNQSKNKTNTLEESRLDEEQTTIPCEYKINPKRSFCQSPTNKSFLFITFVNIAPDYFEKRNLIRSTWANKSISSEFKIIFTFALSPNKTVNKQIEEENQIHRDILQINNFIDNYYNLTTKIMKTFKWISKYCSNAKYIMRIDDDVILNTHYFIDHFKRLPYKKNQMFGFAFYGARPARNQGHKFYVSEKDYPKAVYDPYIDGNKLHTQNLLQISLIVYILCSQKAQLTF